MHEHTVYKLENELQHPSVNVAAPHT